MCWAGMPLPSNTGTNPLASADVDMQLADAGVAGTTVLLMSFLRLRICP